MRNMMYAHVYAFHEPRGRGKYAKTIWNCVILNPLLTIIVRTVVVSMMFCLNELLALLCITAAASQTLLQADNTSTSLLPPQTEALGPKQP